MTIFKLFLIGMLMGLADLVPGISSGTVAYSLNIYQIWIDALNSISLSKLLRLQFKSFLKKIHSYTLIPILSGIAISIAIFTHLMVFVLSHSMLKDIFFLVVSCLLTLSCIHFSKNIKLQSKLDSAYVLLGFAVAIVFSLLPKITNDSPSTFIIFLSATIAAFAMMLPGISGSAVLLLFNLYELLITQLKEFLNSIAHLQFFTSATAFLAIFALGVLVGIAIFSKLLKNLLENHKQKTNLILFGLMIGCAFWIATILVKICITVIFLILLNKSSFIKLFIKNI